MCLIAEMERDSFSVISSLYRLSTTLYIPSLVSMSRSSAIRIKMTDKHFNFCRYELLMVSEIFTALVGLLAVVYAGIAKFLQNKLVDRSQVEAVQAESKKLSKEFSEAKAKGNDKEMERIMKKQMEMLPKMNRRMSGKKRVKKEASGWRR